MNTTLEVLKFLCLGISHAKNDGFLCGRDLQCLCLPTGRRYEVYLQCTRLNKASKRHFMTTGTV
jgi:hypothetical protein